MPLNFLTMDWVFNKSIATILFRKKKMILSLNVVENFQFSCLKADDRSTLLSALSAIASINQSDPDDNYIPDLPKFIAENNFTKEILSVLFSQYTESVYQLGFESGRKIRQNTFNNVEFAPNQGMNRVPDYDIALDKNPIPFIQQAIPFDNRYLEALKLKDKFSDQNLKDFANCRAVQFERFALKYNIELPSTQA